MIEIENADLEKIAEIEYSEGEYTGRLAVRGGLLIPGLLRASPYRIVNYGFVLAEEMPNVYQFGMPEEPTFRLYEIRTIAAFVEALRLNRDWKPTDVPILLENEIAVPDKERARSILADARVPINGL